MAGFLGTQKVRNNTIQFGYVGGLVLLIVFFVVTAKSNLDSQGITSGFDFLWRSTGWDLGFSVLPYSIHDSYGRVMLIGFLNTILVGFISLILASLIGAAIGIMRTSRNKMLRLLGTFYVEMFRNVPLILQVIFWYAVLRALPSPRLAISFFDSVFLSGRGIYFPGINVSSSSTAITCLILLVGVISLFWFSYGKRFSLIEKTPKTRIRRMIYLLILVISLVVLFFGRVPDTSVFNIPVLKGLNIRGGIRISPELLAMIVTISLYGGAYIAEIFRAGFNAISKGQSEAGSSLGLNGWQIFSRIRMPLTIRIVMPTLINQYVWLLKATTVGLAIGFSDFFAVTSTSINQSGQTIELMFILMGGFLFINYLLAWVLNRVNDRIKLKGTQLRI